MNPPNGFPFLPQPPRPLIPMQSYLAQGVQHFIPKPQTNAITRIALLEEKTLFHIFSFLSPAPYFGVLQQLNKRYYKLIHRAWKRSDMTIVLRHCEGKTSPKSAIHKSLIELPTAYSEHIDGNDPTADQIGTFRSVILHDVAVNNFKKVFEADSIEKSLADITIIGYRFAPATWKQFLAHIPARNGFLKRISLIGCLFPKDKMQDVSDAFKELKLGKHTPGNDPILLQKVELIYCDCGNTSISFDSDDAMSGRGSRSKAKSKSRNPKTPVRGKGGRGSADSGETPPQSPSPPTSPSQEQTPVSTPAFMPSPLQPNLNSMPFYVSPANQYMQAPMMGRGVPPVMRGSSIPPTMGRGRGRQSQDFAYDNVAPYPPLMPFMGGAPDALIPPEFVTVYEVADFAKEELNKIHIDMLIRIFKLNVDIDQDPFNDEVSLMCLLARHANVALFNFGLEKLIASGYQPHVNLLINAIVYNRKIAHLITQAIIDKMPNLVNLPFVKADSQVPSKKRKRKMDTPLQRTADLETNRARLMQLDDRYTEDTPLLTACRVGNAQVVALLMEKGARFVSSANGDSPLHIACGSRHFDVVNYLIFQQNHPVNLLNKSNQTCLHSLLAITDSNQYSTEDVNIVKLLLSTKINTTVADSTYGNTALHYAAARSMRDVVSLLLGGGDQTLDSQHMQSLLQAVKVPNARGLIPPMLALQNPSKQTMETVLLMVDKVPDILLQQTNKLVEVPVVPPPQMQPTHMMPQPPTKTTVIVPTSLLFELINAPQDIAYEILKNIFDADTERAKQYLGVRNSDQKTLLHLVCEKKFARLVGILFVERGIDVNAQDSLGRSALHIALETPDCDIVEPLILSGKVNFNLKDKELQQTVVHKCAKQKTHSKHIEKLLVIGANPNEQDKDGNTALHTAIMHDNWDAVPKLITRVNINMLNLRQQTPLLLAVKHFTRGKLTSYAIEQLLEKGANVGIADKEDSDEASALILAVEKQLPDKLLTLLIQHGANANYQTKSSKLTALHMACEQGNLASVIALVEGGANIFIPDQTHSIPLVYSVSTKHEEVTDYLLSKIYDSEEMDEDQITKFQAQVLISKLNITVLDCLLLEFARQNVEVDLAVQCYRQLIDIKVRQHMLANPQQQQAQTAQHHPALAPPSMLGGSGPPPQLAMLQQGLGQLPPHLAQFQQILQQQLVPPSAQQQQGHQLPTPAQQMPTQQIQVAENLQLFHDPSDGNNTILMVSCQEGYIDLVGTFLEWCSLFRSIDGVSDNPLSVVLNDHNDTGNRPLHFCCLTPESNTGCEPNTKNDILQRLLKRGAAVNVQNSDGDTPLHVACRTGNIILVQTLMHFHANQHLRNAKNQTPDQVANEHGHHALVSKMLSNNHDDSIASQLPRRPRKRNKTVEALIKNDELDADIGEEDRDHDHQEDSEDEYKTPEEDSDSDESIKEEPELPEDPQMHGASGMANNGHEFDEDDDFDEDDEGVGDDGDDFVPQSKRRKVQQHPAQGIPAQQQHAHHAMQQAHMHPQLQQHPHHAMQHMHPHMHPHMQPPHMGQLPPHMQQQHGHHGMAPHPHHAMQQQMPPQLQHPHPTLPQQLPFPPHQMQQMHAQQAQQMQHPSQIPRPFPQNQQFYQ